MWGLGHIGGAHINPAVSLAFLATGETNLIRVLFYIPCQLLGSILGALTLYELIPSNLSTSVSSKHILKDSNLQRLKRDINATKILSKNPVVSSSIGVTLLNDEITPFQGFLVEVLITLILIITIFACIDKNRNDIGGSFPLTIGFAVTVGVLFGVRKILIFFSDFFNKNFYPIGKIHWCFNESCEKFWTSFYCSELVKPLDLLGRPYNWIYIRRICLQIIKYETKKTLINRYLNIG